MSRSTSCADRLETIAIGHRIRRARKALGMRQVDLCEHHRGWHSATISNWETGDRAPDAHSLRRLSIALDVTADHLLGLDGH